MSLTLALDCALRRINLGISDGEKFLGELSADVGTRQAEVLPMAVENFLSAFGKTVRDLTLIAMTVGPGYFTGIRVGMSYAAGLAGSLGIMVTPVSTLDAMAVCLLEALASGGIKRAVVPVIPAGRGSLYAAAYEAGPGSEKITLLEPSCVETRMLRERLEKLAEGGRLMITGNTFPPELDNPPCGGFVTQMSVAEGIIKLARALSPVDPADARASYLRSPA
ncbi:MAG: tRNA (adenosine(37)-N6)-threonylcarbamoyltransferase complex dimerization subunit type 1 TsaB [Synergistaceae bacterium]|jgi:tRNA threonylcarbamoyladenosine biosynthesis protein TsaB|nr:tRNA (adenosine(37)-N6)-threonylcarbamoyltransferase complex dimerization subunit type 1 TsaB [Synergistaceae bacterium]